MQRRANDRDLQPASDGFRGRGRWRRWLLGGLGVGMIGSFGSGHAHAAALPIVARVETLCGAEHVLANVFSPHRRDVAVRVWLTNTDAAASAASSVQLTLESNGVVQSSQEPQGALPSGESGPLTFWFPIESVSSDGEVSITIMDPAGPSSVVSWDVSFACVPAPSAHNVMVRLEGAVACPTRGRQWDRRVVAQIPAVAGTGRTYCAYSFEGEGEPDLSSFNVPGVKWEVDAPVVAPLVVPLEQVAIATDVRLGIDQLSLALGQLGNPATSVRIAVIDTAAMAFDAARPDNGDHGRRVGLIARRTACGANSSCPVEIYNQLGLPVTAPDYTEDRVRGGYFGTRGQVADALHRLVDGWEASASTKPLIINLSLGWHSKHDCSDTVDPDCGEPLQTDRASELRVPAVLGYFDAPRLQAHSLGSEAVAVELTRARCLGAMVLAAAGNAVGLDRVGALSPASWNVLEVNDKRCESWGSASPLPPSDSRALVEAVGAVGFDGQPSALTREGSLPRFVALGVGLTVEDLWRPLPNPAPPPSAGGLIILPNGKLSGPIVLRQLTPKNWLDPASGTSLSTAVVSGAAARLWAQRGTAYSAEEVLNELYDAAMALTPNPLLADLYLNAPSPPPLRPEVVEVNGCTALTALGQHCEVASVAGANLVHQKHDELQRVQGAPCGGSNSPCPDAAALDQYEAPWAVPQPWGITCATCSESLPVYSKVMKMYGHTITLDTAKLKRLSGTDAFHSVWVKAGLTKIVVAPQLLTNNVLRGEVFFQSVGFDPASLITRSGPLSGGVFTEDETAIIRRVSP